MSNNRNRGKQSNDDKLFSDKFIPILTEATNDLSLLLGRGYSINSALLLVGNRYKLNKRQRKAVMRISCSEKLIIQRQTQEVKSSDVIDKNIEIDGFNLLILLESILSGAYVFECRDGLFRDISSVHGSYKRVNQTEEGIKLLGRTLKDLQVKSAHWYLDQPVSNSGKLKTMLMGISKELGFNWSVELVYDPDKVLIKSKNIVVSSDGWIIDNAAQWFNLGAVLVERITENKNILKI